ncbi:MAG: hypothetical protein ACLFPE_08660 [Bacteroidales bacterium]
MNIVTEYPGWFFAFCILLGALFAGILYYKNKKEDFSKSTMQALAIFRFLAVTLIAFLLLSPMIKTIFRTSEKPLIIVAQDNSTSLVVGGDSSFYLNEYRQQLDQMISDLQQDYEIRTFTFSESVDEIGQIGFSGKQTDISNVFDEMTTRYANRNVGALLLASDGLYNKGLNPVYASASVNFPVYTLALGDTSVRKDIYIQKVNFNRIAFLGNSFPIEVIVGANMSRGLKSTLTVSRGGTVLFSKNLVFGSEQYFETVRLQLDAEEAGMQRYRIRLAPIEGEVSTQNNQQDIFIDILDSKQKILILAAAPHPDISALKTAIESNYNYEVTDAVIGDFAGQPAEYNLVILHQLPAKKEAATTQIKAAIDDDVPLLFVVGAQSSLPQFNSYQTGVQIITEQTSSNESLPALNEEFALFTMSDETRKSIDVFPPLLAPFGEFKTTNATNVLFYQQIGSLVTGYPLIAFNQTLDRKTGVIAGEGIWRWRLTGFQKNGNHLAFNEVITKVVQFLSVKVDKSFFKVEGKNNFLENETVEFDAEVYNPSYELINEPEVEMTITNSSGVDYPFTFGKTANAYHLNAGVLPVDNYTWEARVRVGDRIYTDDGSFTVSPLNVEAVNTIADHTLLYQLAAKHQGAMIYPDQMVQFPEMLQQREDIKTITYSEKRYSELVNVFWIFLLILALLTTEWFIRKRGGSY